MKTETDLARAVVTELQRQGYETYEEVVHGGRRADIVAVAGPLVFVVECKVSMSLKLFDQMAQWRGEASYVVGAVNSARVGPAALRYLQFEGFGLWTVSASEIIERVRPRLNRVNRDQWSLKRKLRPEHRSGEYAAAGSQGGYWTPFRSTCRDLAEIVRKEPGIELREALTKIDHHYSSAKSAISALPGLIRKGVVAGVRLEDGRPLRVFPNQIDRGA